MARQKIDTNILNRKKNQRTINKTQTPTETRKKKGKTRKKIPSVVQWPINEQNGTLGEENEMKWIKKEKITKEKWKRIKGYINDPLTPPTLLFSRTALLKLNILLILRSTLLFFSNLFSLLKLILLILKSNGRRPGSNSNVWRCGLIRWKISKVSPFFFILSGDRQLVHQMQVVNNKTANCRRKGVSKVEAGTQTKTNWN